MTCPAASGRPCSESAQSASVALIHSQKGGPKQQLWEDERAGAHRTLGMEQHDGPGARNVIHETKGTQEGESGGGRACSPPRLLQFAQLGPHLYNKSCVIGPCSSRFLFLATQEPLTMAAVNVTWVVSSLCKGEQLLLRLSQEILVC